MRIHWIVARRMLKEVRLQVNVLVILIYPGIFSAVTEGVVG